MKTMRMTRYRPALAAGFLVACVSTTALANGDGGADLARAFVEENCARCHAIGMDDASPFEAAPPLRELPQKYPVEGLAEAFAEGIVVGHPAMPEFELEPEQIDLLLEYLSSLAE